MAATPGVVFTVRVNMLRFGAPFRRSSGLVMLRTNPQEPGRISIALALDVLPRLMIILYHEGRQPEPRSLEQSFRRRIEFLRFNPSRVVHPSMARRGLSTLLIGLMTVLNGTVMLLGPGVHALPGCGHHAVATRGLCVVDGLSVVSGGDNTSPCPICEYLAQGQVVAERASVVAADFSTLSILSLPCIPPDLRPLRTLGCRAPPAAHTL
jgi:hypothetical protein